MTNREIRAILWSLFSLSILLYFYTKIHRNLSWKIYLFIRPPNMTAGRYLSSTEYGISMTGRKSIPTWWNLSCSTAWTAIMMRASPASTAPLPPQWIIWQAGSIISARVNAFPFTVIISPGNRWALPGKQGLQAHCEAAALSCCASFLTCPTMFFLRAWRRIRFFCLILIMRKRMIPIWMRNIRRTGFPLSGISQRRPTEESP